LVVTHLSNEHVTRNFVKTEIAVVKSNWCINFHVSYTNVFSLTMTC